MSSMLTTIDNPYDPFDQYDQWYQWDTTAGYCSNQMLARVAVLSEDLSEADFELAIEQAIDEVVSENVCGMWTKVSRDP